MTLRIFLSILVLITYSSIAQKQQVDLIVHNGKVYTVDSHFSEAQAFAVDNGKIIKVGSNKEILGSFEGKENVDAKGKAVFPGFIDAHAHFLNYGFSLFTVQLYDSKSMQDVVERVVEFAKAHPGNGWITGRGWDQNKFEGKQFPDNTLLTKAFPDRPVLLTRVDGHASIANEKALQLSGVKVGQTVTGGEFVVKDGKLTGLLIDNAVDFVQNVIPKPDIKQLEAYAVAAQKNCFEYGLTTITDCGLNYDAIDALDLLQKEGKLKMKLYIMMSDDKSNYDRFLAKGPYKTERMYLKGVKVFADGALGSRGACLLKPYSDQPGWYGFLLSSPSHFDSVAAMLSKTDFQMCTHAIGDSANREILSVYAKYLKGKNDKRWRIEHAQIVDKNDFHYFGDYSIIPSVQPTHATSDMYWAEERLGPERIKEAYANKDLLHENGWIPLGTDFPVEDISPFKTFLAAVFRQDARGYPKGGFQPENALNRQEAIRGMTIWAAKAAFLDNETGSIEEGKKADFIILDKNLMEIPENQVLETKVIATYSNGEKVY